MVQLKVERTAGIHAKGANVPASASLMGGESKFVMSWAVGGNGASRSLVQREDGRIRAG